jgi:hypothetical protein
MPDEKTFEKLFQRCREIQPSTTRQKLQGLLRTNLWHHSKVYICLPSQDADRDLIASDMVPITCTGVEPDGVASSAVRASNKAIGSWTPSTGFGNLLGRLSF